MQGGLDDPRTRQWRIEPVDPAVGVLRAAEVDLRIETAIPCPETKIPAGHLHIDLLDASQLPHPAAPEGVADRDLAEPRERAVLEARRDRSPRCAETAEPRLADDHGVAGARANHRPVQHVARLVLAQHVLAERAVLAANFGVL